MKKKSKLYVVTIFIVLFTLSISGCSTKKLDNLSLEVSNILIKDKLEESKEIITYTGISSNEHLLNEPQQGNVYVILNISLNNQSKDSDYNTKDILLNIDGSEYKRVKKDDFLDDFGYFKIKNKINKDSLETGYIIFEIPEDKSKVDFSKWILTDKSSSINLNISNIEIDDNVPNVQNITESQSEIEKNIYSEYNKSKNTFENPFVKLNPYNNTPLGAISIFSTDYDSEISVKILGKSKDTDVEYTIEGYKKEHQIPIIGLYPNKKNKVILTSKGEDGKEVTTEIEIKTESIPNNIQNKDLEVSINNTESTDFGLTLIIDQNRLLVDQNGDIRGFITDIDGKKIDSSGVDELLSNGRLLVSTNSYENFSCIYEIDWLGKVYWSYSAIDTAHHDAEELPNGNILYASLESIYEINRESNETVRTIKFNEILENPGKSLELRDQGSDWFHINTIEYIEKDNSILVSARNQHAVVKLDYSSLEVDWILTPSIETQPNLSGKELKPVGDVEWFYSQHQPTVLPDIDNNPETLDLLLFDNGAHRSTSDADALKEEDMYSRIVHYRINESNKTVEQVFEFGKEKGLEFYSDIQSGVQYLENAGTYLGTFDSGTLPTWSSIISEKNTGNKSHIVEVDKNGSILHQIDLNTSYRAYRISDDFFAKGYEPSNNKYYAQPQNYIDESFNKTDMNIIYDITDISQNNGLLNISGYAFIENNQYLSDKLYLILSSENKEYYFNLNRSATVLIPETKLSLSDEESLEKPNRKLGFSTKYIDLNSIEVGKYNLKLGVTLDGSNDIVIKDTSYYYRKKGTLEQEQALIDNNINSKFKEKKYTISDPLVINNPYEIAPLTSLVLFESDKEAKVSIKVKGKDSNSDITNVFEKYNTLHQIPIYGLYPEYKNTIEITLEYADGTSETKNIEINTKSLPKDFQSIEVITSDKEELEDGLIFTVGSMANSIYPMAIDKNGEVRWYLDNNSLGITGPIRRLENGNIIINSDNMIAAPYYTNGFYEISMFGKINKFNTVNGLHHDVVELPDNNFLALANNPNKSDVVEDYIVKIDRNTNEVIKSWDLEQILGINPVADTNYEDFGTHDWLHINSIDYSQKDNCIIISARHQDAVIKFNMDTNEIMWILSDPNDEWPQHLQDKILKPLANDFVYNYGQHAATQLENGDLIMFDNGNHKSKNNIDNVEANDNYSEIRRFKIDEVNKTIEEIYSYGKERKNELYAPYVGDVDIINDSYLATFGGIIKDEDGNNYNDPRDLLNTENDVFGEGRILEIKGNSVVFEVKIRNGRFGNLYRSEKMNIYDKSDDNLNILTRDM